MDIKIYLSKEKPFIDTRIKFYLQNYKKDLSKVSSQNIDIFDRLELFCTSGKGIRGGLFVITSELFGFTNKEILYAIAVIFEILHSSLLIHDDISDNDEIRRGKPSMHAQYKDIGTTIRSKSSMDFGKSMGMLVGDLGFFIAFSILQKLSVPFEKKENLYQIIFKELTTVTLGQMDDITFSHSKSIPSVENILKMYEYKTAHYTFSLPLLVASIVANQSKNISELFEELGIYIGILFQIRDDELGLFSTEESIGKPIGSDIRENKKTILRAYLEKNMSENEKKNIDTEDLKTIMKLFDKYKIKKFIKDIKNNYYSKSISIIEKANLENNNKKIFIDLIDYVVNRTS